jgi:DNA-binding MarR family transcriptional regulator
MLERWKEMVERMQTLYPMLDPVAARTMYELIGTYGQLQHFMTPFLEAHDLSFGSLAVLIALRKSPGGTAPMPQVCKQLLVTRQNVSALVSGLVERKLIERVASPDDARVKVLRLTTKGIALLDAYLPGHYERLKSVFHVLREPEAALLQDYLGRVRGRLQELTPPDNRQPLDD